MPLALLSGLLYGCSPTSPATRPSLPVGSLPVNEDTGNAPTPFGIPVENLEEHFLWHEEAVSGSLNLATDGEILVMGHVGIQHPDFEFELLREPYLRALGGEDLAFAAEFDTSIEETGTGFFMGYPVGDLDGDGHTEIVGTEWGFGGAVLRGPHDFAIPASQAVHPSAASWSLPSTVGGEFESCDLNRDGLNDLCSSLGFALSPAPFSEGELTANAAFGDRIAVVDLPGMHGVLLSSSLAASLFWIPASVLPSSENPASLADHTIELGGWANALNVRVGPGADSELVALIGDEETNVELVGWSLDGDFSERYRIPLGFGGRSPRELEVGDWNQDGTMDVAVSFAHQIGVFLGPITQESEPELWWATPVPDNDEAVGFYLAAVGSDLWVREVSTRRLYRIDAPHLVR